MSRRSERGLALVSVLFGLAILSIIAAAILAASAAGARIDRNAWNGAHADAIAEAAVNRAVLALLDGRTSRHWRIDSVPRDFVFDGAHTRIWIQDETGKIDINAADPHILLAAFQSAGANPDKAQAIADRIMDRRTKSPAPALAFLTVDDLASIPEAAPFLPRLASVLTVFSHAASVDTSTAPRDVLQILPDMDAQKISDLLSARDKAYDDQRLAPDTPGAALPPTHSFMIVAETSLGTTHRVRRAVVTMTGDPTLPWIFSAWN